MTSTTAETTIVERETLHQLFEGARTTHRFTDEPVDLDIIRRAYEDLRWAPTAFNNQPLRLTVVAGEEARRAVVEHLMSGNQEKTLAAPLTLVAAYDPQWHEHMPFLTPGMPGLRENFADKPDARAAMGRDNALIQLGYLLVALRAHGLQVGPMTGLDPAGVDTAVHAENGWKTLAVINVGHAPDPEHDDAQHPRGGRFEFEHASQVR
ncbi:MULTISPECIES: malonic semialdehyde reductase [unclassified Nesterenkonia]|uniref:malonic semialdehyde reductase n=1 Tax=unclassified Nesterenkonia TaxID=2629769 RepID=UPI0008728EBF|nr:MULTISPECIES: malonic semialdehyde reductase [unclassified Nesterenkonia]MDS2174275.1 malonic semialdehyde reductase [Nesterenkonia sp. CL21]OSM42793.1 malonic semialdehyde reductase [Nesterenkonia sp. PF2B19]